MAILRVFVSSTHDDLEHIWSPLERLITSLGYDPVLSDRGNIAYVPDRALDESCYEEVRSCDIFVLIIGGRYGSAASDNDINLPPDFFDEYDSITRKEYRAAVDVDLPMYIFIKHAVYSEFSTYQRNRANRSVKYAHVDSINVFRFIEEILAQPRNNPIRPFESYADIEEWLKLQLAGFFRQLIRARELLHASPATKSYEATQAIETLQKVLQQGISKLPPAEISEITNAILAVVRDFSDKNAGEA